MSKEKEVPDQDKVWEPGGTLGNDPRYARALPPKEARELDRKIDRALGWRLRLKRAWYQLWH